MLYMKIGASNRGYRDLSHVPGYDEIIREAISCIEFVKARASDGSHIFMNQLEDLKKDPFFKQFLDA